METGKGHVTITDAKYTTSMPNEVGGIVATIDGVIVSVPLDPGNGDYNEIMKRVDAGTLTIADADPD